jgi:hypothetical protein
MVRTGSMRPEQGAQVPPLRYAMIGNRFFIPLFTSAHHSPIFEPQVLYYSKSDHVRTSNTVHFVE